jgi:branched-chain amino acid transport system substrate-binding protein
LLKRITSLLALFFCASAHADVFVGVAGPMSGQNAAYGQQMMSGAQAAADKINAAGGINGEPITLIAADDACDARRAVAAAQEFVAKDVRFVVGHFCSNASIAAAEVYAKADIVMLSPTASNPTLTEKGQWNVLRIASRDDGQADVAAARIKSEKPGAKVAVVLDGSPLLAQIAARFPGDTQVVIAAGGTSFPQAVETIRASGATVVYLASGSAEAGALAGDIKDAGLAVSLYGPDSLVADAYWERAGEAAEGTLMTFPADPMMSPKAQSVIAQIKAAGGDAQGAVLPGYAAIEVLAEAAKARSVNDGKAMADWLKSGSVIETVLGPVSFDRKGDVSPQRFDWYRWSQGSYTRERPAN